MKYKKIALLFFMFFIILTFAGCNQIYVAQNLLSTENKIPYESIKSAIKTENISDLYKVIKKNVENGEDTCIISKTITGENLAKETEKVVEENALLGYIKSYEYIERGDIVYARVIYSEGKEKFLEKYNKINEYINKITKQIITPNMTDYEKELAIHDYIINNTIYDSDNFKNGIMPTDSNTAYGVFTKGIAVCGGYTEAMHRLLIASGIESKTIIGESNGIGHTWNLIKLENEFYHLDVTFDDPVGDSKNNLSYKYFNLTDEDISKDHVFDKDYYNNANGKKFNYYTYNNLVIKNKTEFYNRLEELLSSKKDYITIKSLNQDIKTFNPNTVYKILEENPKLRKQLNLDDSLRYIYDEKHKVIDIYLTYK